MTHANQRLDDRTKYEAELDLKFGWRYNEMNARLLRRIDFAFGFIGIFGGSGAFIAAIGDFKTLGIVSGAAIAAIAVIERLFGAIERAVAHEDAKDKFVDLLIRAPKMQLTDIEKELKTLQAKSRPGVNSLLVPAYNLNLIANGRSDCLMAETGWQKFMALLA